MGTLLWSVNAAINYHFLLIIFCLLIGVEIFDQKMVPERWTVVFSSSESHGNNIVEILTSPVKATKRKKPLSIEDRFNLADQICRRICSLIAENGGHAFALKINALKNMEELLRQGKDVAVVGINADGLADVEINQVVELEKGKNF